MEILMEFMGIPNIISSVVSPTNGRLSSKLYPCLLVLSVYGTVIYCIIAHYIVHIFSIELRNSDAHTHELTLRSMSSIFSRYQAARADLMHYLQTMRVRYD